MYIYIYIPIYIYIGFSSGSQPTNTVVLAILLVIQIENEIIKTIQVVIRVQDGKCMQFYELDKFKLRWSIH